MQLGVIILLITVLGLTSLLIIQYKAQCCSRGVNIITFLIEFSPTDVSFLATATCSDRCRSSEAFSEYHNSRSRLIVSGELIIVCR